MKKISILGSTGSIGTQALEVVSRLSDKFEIVGLAAGNNVEELLSQIKQFKPKVVSVKSEKAAIELKKQVSGVEVLFGKEGLVEIAKHPENDMALISVTGMNGLYPTLAAIENNIDIALANKETLVAAGDIVMKRAREKNVNILPVDSEHSAIYQCIKDINQVRKLIITASGGPFRTKTLEEIEKATVAQTLTHPKWSMGSKITVDSATLMNKGLEVIEAHHLFGFGYDDIEVVVHPQSIIHSAIECKDGSVIAQIGLPSMHIPIQYALTHPERCEGIKTNSFSFAQIRNLEFFEPDYKKFPCLQLAFDAGRIGGTTPTVLNAANEEAVYAYLEEKIGITEIAKIVEKAMESHSNIETPDLNDIVNADAEAREFVKARIASKVAV